MQGADELDEQRYSEEQLDISTKYRPSEDPFLNHTLSMMLRNPIMFFCVRHLFAVPDGYAPCLRCGVSAEQAFGAHPGLPVQYIAQEGADGQIHGPWRISNQAWVSTAFRDPEQGFVQKYALFAYNGPELSHFL